MEKRPTSRRHLGRLLWASILLAGAMLAAVLALLSTPSVTGYTPAPIRPIPPEAFQALGNAPQSPFALVVTPEPALLPTGRPRPFAVVPTPELLVEQNATPKPAAAQRAVPSVADAKAYALARLGSTQYGCLLNIVSHEDGTWDPYRTNASSGAYGIPQALPGSKMATAGSDWRWNRITQVKWLIGYVGGRYGSACGAWSFWLRNRWY